MSHWMCRIHGLSIPEGEQCGECERGRPGLLSAHERRQLDHIEKDVERNERTLKRVLSAVLSLLPERPEAVSLAFSFSFTDFSIQGENMTATMLPTDTKRSTVSPVMADGVTPSTATLSAISFTSSDPTIATATPDTTNPATVVLTGLGKPGTVIITSSATATEPDGTTTEVITGSLTLILAVPPPAPAAALVFSPLA